LYGSYDDYYHYNVKPGIYFSEDGGDEREDENPGKKSEIPNYCSARLFPDCAGKGRFSFREQPLSSARDLNRRTHLDRSKRRGF